VYDPNSMPRLHLILLLGWALRVPEASFGHDVPVVQRLAPKSTGSTRPGLVAHFERLRGGATVAPQHDGNVGALGRGLAGKGGRPGAPPPAHGGRPPPGERYPRSYTDRDANEDATTQLRAGSTPWKGANTPRYMHSSPDARAHAADDFGEVVTVQPTGEHTASVIWLHGLGDTGHTWSAVASWLQMSWCRFIFPTAPSRQVTIKEGYSMPSWFDFNSLDMHSIDEDAASLQASVAYLLALVQREIDAGVRPERVLLAGFAQVRPVPRVRLVRNEGRGVSD